MDNKEIARRLRELTSLLFEGTSLANQHIRQNFPLITLFEGNSVAKQIYALADELDPPLQVIDLSPLVGSNVICEFWNGNGDKPPTGSLGFLGKIAPKVCAGKDVYHSRHGVLGTSCRPLYNHPNVYMGEVWPVPEGFNVEWIYKPSDRWELVVPCNAIGRVYRITGVKPGWRLPFEGGE